MALPISKSRNGHIVALEGPADLVSTQLRLLPPSAQILTLPSLQHYIKDITTTDPGAPFDPRELIRTYHTAAQTRHAEALDFLRPGTTSGTKRLVFMHGGTMSAQAACLETIMEHEPDWNIEVADATYCRLVSNGLAGLSGNKPPRRAARASMQPKHEPTPAASPSRQEDDRESVWDSCMAPEDDTMGSRIMRAMRAADALDKETEFLQPDADEVELTVKLVDIPSRSRTSKRSSLSNSGPPRSPREKPPVSPASSASRKPSLRIRIPSPSIPWAGDVAASAHRRPSSRASHPPCAYPARESSLAQRPQTADAGLSPRQKPRAELFGMANLAIHDQTVPRELETDSEKAETQPFQEILPVLEDLVLQFSSETPDELQDFIFRRLSDGLPLGRCDTASSHGRGRPLSDRDGRPTGEGSPWMQNTLVHGLPTPGHSPTPLDTAVEDMRLYSLSVDQETAVSIQNCLRSFLASEFPLPDHACSRPNSADGRKDAGLWKPLECDPQWMASPDGARRLDLILAVGAESRVKKTRLAEVVGQIEKLGFKTSGDSRSGRLDLRYLIANAMQAFTAQPLAKQVQSNPFVDRALLAALIIPHLERYMAAHPDVRFLLIEYPAEHLTTILALQTLIGTEMMKVVGIINGDSSPPADRRPSEGFRSLNPQGAHMAGARLGSCSFSKGNFLLASQASGFETAAFVAAIRESLISISDFYIPERPLYKQPRATQSPPHQRPAYPTLNVNFKQQGATLIIITPPSSPSSPSRRHRRSPRASPPKSAHPRSHPTPTTATSSASTSPSSSSSAAAAAAARRNERIRWGSVNYAPSSRPPRGLPLNFDFDFDEDEDEDEDRQDDEERRLMPMYLRRREAQGNGQKALRWLGLV
ncbi:hypothetical protein BT67DRAFT_65100 [Trichocladium antarcticum]|uniref:Uncharacterized protein n=1 Tax=Trichocladium antarcticum TaxID=1450529 RepID=A0AAN6ZC74_9PEZI|nr:hypothetical protein BT67DRAFT_65100 [Trichocladium antarcticum]